MAKKKIITVNKTSREPLHKQIKRQLLAMIVELGVGKRVPTETAIAKDAGVSRLTVHKVLSELQHDGIVERRPGAGTYVLHTDKIIHRPAGTSREGSIITVYPDWFSHDMWEKVRVAESLAVSRGCHMHHVRLERDTDYHVLDALLETLDNVRGIIVIPPGAAITDKAVKYLDSLGIPAAVLCCKPTSATKPKNVTFIYTDEYDLGFQSISHLISLGHIRIGYVNNEPLNPGFNDCLRGMKQALYAHNLKLRDFVRNKDAIKAWENSTVAAYNFTKTLLAEQKNAPPTALVYGSFQGAIAGLRALREAGLDVPGDVSLIAFEHNDELSGFICPSLTTLATEAQTLLETVFDRLFTPDVRKETVIVPVTLQPRESTARVN